MHACCGNLALPCCWLRVCAVKAQLYRCRYSVPRRVLRRELLVATCAPTDAYDGNQAELTRRIIEMRLAYRDTSDYRRAQLTRLCAQKSRRGFYIGLPQRQTQQLRNDVFRKSSRGKRGGASGPHEVSAARGKSRERAPDKTGVRKRGGKEKKRRAALMQRRRGNERVVPW